MAKTTTQVNFTTIKGARPSRKVQANQYLEAKAETWINAKIKDGWSLRDVLVVDTESVHVVITRKETA
jgi:hypothetical protein